MCVCDYVSSHSPRSSFHNTLSSHNTLSFTTPSPLYHLPYINLYINAQATEAIKPILKDYYMYDARPVFKALWDDEPHVKHVVPDASKQGVYWYCK